MTLAEVPQTVRRALYLSTVILLLLTVIYSVCIQIYNHSVARYTLQSKQVLSFSTGVHLT